MYAPRFLLLPKATQIIYVRLRQLVDKYAHVNHVSGLITYTERSNPKLKRFIDQDEALRVYTELYCEA